MRRQEFLLNFVLLAVIGGLIYFIFASQNAGESEEISDEALIAQQEKRGTETSYNPALADAKYKKFGTTDLFKPILTPLPPPPPKTPEPTKTPDINAVLGNWKVESVMDGEVWILDRAKEQKQPEEARFPMKLNEQRPVDIGKGEMKNVILIKMDENFENPSATFKLEGGEAPKTIKMMEDTGPPPQ